MTDTLLLLPCPFCGGEALCCKMEETRHTVLMWRIVCLDCVSGTTFHPSKERVIKIWNTRK